MPVHSPRTTPIPRGAIVRCRRIALPVDPGPNGLLDLSCRIMGSGLEAVPGADRDFRPVPGSIRHPRSLFESTIRSEGVNALNNRILPVLFVLAFLMAGVLVFAQSDVIEIGDIAKIYEPSKFGHKAHVDYGIECKTCHHKGDQKKCSECHKAQPTCDCSVKLKNAYQSSARAVTQRRRKRARTRRSPARPATPKSRSDTGSVRSLT